MNPCGELWCPAHVGHVDDAGEGHLLRGEPPPEMHGQVANLQPLTADRVTDAGELRASFIDKGLDTPNAREREP